MSGRRGGHSNLSKHDFELIAEFRYTLRRFLGFSEAAATRHGVTSQQYQALLAIEGFPGRSWVTVGELAERLCVAHHSAVGLVDRMEALRLVNRERSATDRRRVQVNVTAQGRAVMEKLYRVHRTELKTIGPRLIGILQQASLAASGGDEAKGYSSSPCSMPEIVD